MGKISKKGMTHREWLQARQAGIGGSEVAAILGLTPKWKTAYALWQEKIGEVVETEENEFMLWGKVLEPAIRREYKKRTGYRVTQDNHIRVSEKYPHLICNVDGLISDPEKDGMGVLECKTINAYKHQKIDNELQVPLEYFCQIQHNMFVTGLKWGDFAMLIGGNKLSIIRIEYDEEYMESYQLPALNDFWNNHVIPRTPPPMQAEDAEVLSPVPESSVEADAVILTMWENAVALKKKIKTHEEELTAITDEIKRFMTDKESVICNGKSLVTWKSVKQNPKFDATTFKKENVALYEKYLVPPKNPARMFLLKSNEEEN
jgi:putative phage-type endonuclease